MPGFRQAACAGVAILAAGAAARAAAPPADVGPEPVLRVQCARYAANPDLPWALAHGITALGKDFKAANGKLAADVIVSGFLEIERGDGGVHYTFPPTRQLRPIEPHVNLMVKSLVLAGVTLGRKFHAPDGTWVTLGILLDDARARFRYQPSDGFWSRSGWTIDAIGSRLAPKRATFVNGFGETIDWRRVVDEGFRHLEEQNGFFEDAMAQGLLRVDKRKQGIYSHTCGGFHLLQPLLMWAQHVEVRAALRPRIERQLRILFYRLQSERLVYEEALAKSPEYRLLILVQELKFYGHWLETLGRLFAAGVFAPDAEQKGKVVLARALLAQAVQRLETEKAFASMEAIEKQAYQTYLDLIGDACHALNGWRLTAPIIPAASTDGGRSGKSPAGRR